VTGRRSSHGEAYWAGYERGVQAGHTVGYAEGVAVLDEAAGLLAGSRPSRTVAMLAARERMAETAGPALTPREIRDQAAASWGLPAPADLADTTTGHAGLLAEPTTEPAAEAVPVGAELADDDDWAWQV
jgi:hypothetical protein